MKKLNLKKEVTKNLFQISTFTIISVGTIVTLANWFKSETIDKFEVQASQLDVTPTPTPSPVLGGSGGGVEYKDLIYKVFGEVEGRLMYAIVRAEHNNNPINPKAVNSTPVEHSVGICQINLAKDYGKGTHVHWSKVPGTTLEEKTRWLQDPENNLTMCKVIFGTSGPTAWSTYKDGKYKKYL